MGSNSDWAQAAPAIDLAEPQPIGEFLRTLARYLIFVLPLALLAALVAALLTTPDAPTPSAQAQVGLTQEVIWPFYDSARQRAALVVAEQDFTDELVDRLDGMDPLTVSLESPESQAFVFLNTTAADPASAVAAANEAADLLLERDRQRLAAAAQAELDRTEQLLAASAARLAVIDAELSEVAPAEAAARAAVADDPTPSARENLLQLELERTGLAQRRNEELRLLVGIEIDVAEAASQVQTITPELEVLSRASLPEDARPRSLIPIIAAFVVAMMVGLAFALLWDRIRGRISSRWHAEQLAGVRVLGDMGGGGSLEHQTGLLMSGIIREVDPQSNIVCFAGLPRVQINLLLDEAVRWCERAGVRAIVVGELDPGFGVYGSGTVLDSEELDRTTDFGSVLHGVSTVRMRDSAMAPDAAMMRPILEGLADRVELLLLHGGNVGSELFERTMIATDVTVLVAGRGTSRVNELQRAARLMASQPARLLGVYLSRPDKLRDGLPVGELVSDDWDSKVPELR